MSGRSPVLRRRAALVGPSSGGFRTGPEPNVGALAGRHPRLRGPTGHA
ncbi:MAG: hypothetical protein ACK52I_07500 [Pseudomonadota bacterium]